VAVVIPDWVVDAPDILDSQCLLRRVPDHGLIEYELESSNFREKEEGTGLSVTLWEGERDMQDLLRFAPGFGVTTLVVADVRSLGLKIMRIPLVGNLNHCEVWGIGSKTPKKLKRVHRWAVHNAIIPLDRRIDAVVFQTDWEPRRLPD
jgi:hypothetical protein